MEILNSNQNMCATEAAIRTNEEFERLASPTAPRMENTMQNIMIIGVYIWGAMYTAGVFVASLEWGNRTAALLAIASAGIAYLCQFVGAIAQDGVTAAHKASLALCALSVLLGLAAGVALIIGA